MPEITLGRLAEHLGAVLTNGAAEDRVGRLAALADAGPGDLTFLANPRYRSQLAGCRAGAVVVSRDIADQEATVALLKTDNPDLAFAQASLLLCPPPPLPQGRHPTAVVAPDAKLGDNVAVGAGTVVEAGAEIGAGTVLYPQVYVGAGSKIGSGCCVYPGVVLYHQVTVGDRCIIHAGAVIGSDGFGFAWTGKNYAKIPQVGTVVIENDVEIGANTCIDRARFGETRISAGTKLDNLIQIAHNVKIGPLCAFAAQVGIAGSAEVGAGVQMGGQAAVVGHIKVGSGLTIVGQSAISKSIPGREAGVGKERLTWIDSPAQPLREHLEEARNLKALGKLRQTVRELEQRLSLLEGEKEDHGG